MFCGVIDKKKNIEDLADEGIGVNKKERRVPECSWNISPSHC